MFNRLLIVPVIVIIKLLQVDADATIVYKAKNMECLPDPKYAENATCKVKAVDWNKSVIEMDCDLILPLRNTTIRFEVLKKDYTNKYQPFLIDVVMDVCAFLSKKKFPTYGKILYKVVGKYTNVNHSCPLTGHLMSRDLYIDPSLLPTFPLGYYMISITITENFRDRPSELVGIIKYYVQATEMVRIRNKKQKC